MNHWLYPGLSKGDRIEALYKNQIRTSGEVDSILKSVCHAFGVDEDDIKGRSRRQEISDARHCFIFLTRMHTGMTLMKLGEYLRRNHATILHSLKVFEQIESVDKTCRKKRMHAEELLTSNLKHYEGALQEVEN